ncbi:MAG: alginate export family protein [Hyphomonadaceae bacterium]|nr:alginate export family protein [Hyphomonadaceae bacterium]
MSTGRIRGLHWAAGASLSALALFSPRAAAETPFKPERFDETWPPNGAGAPFGAEFKNIEVAPDVSVSFGGDMRWRFAALDAPRLGLGGAEADSWLLQRLLLHADLRFGDDARVFLQVGAHDGVSREIPSSTDDDGIDMQQAFVDLNHDFGDAHVTLRLGRQELALGPRFLTTRDSGNVRQRHDMGRLIIRDGAWRFDAFAGHPTGLSPGPFDDEADQAQTFYGGRLQYAATGVTTDISVYEHDRDSASLAGVTARDERVSAGLRSFGRRGDVDFDIEAIFQSGAFGGDDIRAVGLAADIGRTFPHHPLAPRIGARFTYGSGDSDSADGVAETFAPSFPSTSWFGQNGLASFANIVEVAGLLALTPRPDVTVTSKVAAVWRADTNDFLYAGGAYLAGTSGGEDAFTGLAPSVSVAWRPTENIMINPYVSYVALSDEVRSRGAHDVTYAHLSISLRF